MSDQAIPILPHYWSYLSQGSHYLHIALDMMNSTPCVTKEQFEEMVGIYSSLADFMDKIYAENTKGE